jgi:hypothetical protein
MAVEQRAELLVNEVRRKTGHRTYDAAGQQGLPQREFVEFLGEAQDRIYNLLLQERPTLYRREDTIDLTAGTAEYDLPEDCFLSHNVTKVEYSPTGNAQDYLNLEQRTSGEQVSIQGYPDSYFFRDGQIILSPIPDSSAGVVRLEYQYVIPSLDIRRGTIASSATSGGYYTSVTMTPATVSEETEAEFTDGLVDYVAVVDRNGTVTTQFTGCPVSSYNSTTGQITFVTSSVSTTGNAFAVGNYVVFGRYASTHSQLPQVAKRYLVEYACMRCQIRDSNALEAALTSPLMQMIEREVLDAIANLEEDTFAIPILDYDYLGEDYE